MNAKRYKGTARLLIALLALPVAVQAQTPPAAISFQGFLTDSAGVPINANKDITIKLFDESSGGIQLWARAYSAVPVDNGAFNLVLEGGDTGNLAFVAFDKPVFLEISLPSDGQTISPRSRLSMAPYAQSLRNLRIKPETSVDGPNLIGGASANSAGASIVGATIAGGGKPGPGFPTFPFPNTVSANYGSVGGGLGNTASGVNATVGGGTGNQASNESTVVGGGSGNTASGFTSVVGGGNGNTASGADGTVSGGDGNTAGPAQATTVVGGSGNTASGAFATVIGGSANTASGDFSMAMGRRAKATHSGTFVWGGDTNADFVSTGTDQFLIRAAAGVGINVTEPLEKLHVDGAVRADRVVYNGPRTHVISYTKFQPAFIDSFVRFEGRRAPPNGIAGNYFTAGGANEMQTGVQLPHDATVTSFACRIDDDSDVQDITCELVHSNGATMATVSTTGTPSITTISTSTISYATINNVFESYYISIFSSGTWSDVGADLRVFSAKINYTVDEAE